MKFHTSHFYAIILISKHSFIVCFVYDLSPIAFEIKIYGLSAFGEEKNFVAHEK